MNFKKNMYLYCTSEALEKITVQNLIVASTKFIFLRHDKTAN